MEKTERKLWLSVAAVFAAGALAVNAIWVYVYYEMDRGHGASIEDIVRVHDSRIARIKSDHEERVTKLESSHKRQMGAMRNRVEVKIDRVLDKLDKLPSTPIIIETRRELEGMIND